MYILIILKQIWQYAKRHQDMSYILKQIYYLQRKFKSLKYSNRPNFCDCNKFSEFCQDLFHHQDNRILSFLTFMFILSSLILVNFHPHPLSCQKCSQSLFSDTLLCALSNRNNVKTKSRSFLLQTKRNKNFYSKVRTTLGVQNKDITKVKD